MSPGAAIRRDTRHTMVPVANLIIHGVHDG